MEGEAVSAAIPSRSDESSVPSLPDDRELLTHIVLEGFPTTNGSQFISAGPTVAEARASGMVIKSLCGKSWIPTRTPSNFPLCPTCIEETAEFEWPVPDH